MADDTDPKLGRKLMMILGATLVVAAIVVGVRWSRGDFSSTGASEPAQASAPSEEEAQGERPRSKKLRPNRPGGPGVPYKFDRNLQKLIKSHARFEPPRPLRFLVKYGSRRTKQEAHDLATKVREEFTSGKRGSYELIREHSDLPRGIPQDLLKRYENLPPTKVSPLLEIEGGYVLLFGTPTEPPEGAVTPTGAPQPPAEQGDGEASTP